MKVLKDPKWVGRVLKCKHCGCEFELRKSDRKKIKLYEFSYPGERDVRYYYIRCPSCKNEVKAGSGF